MSIRTAGRARRKFIAGIRLCPPARNFAVIAVFGLERERMLKRGGGDIFEGRRLHGRSRQNENAVLAFQRDAARKV